MAKIIGSALELVRRKENPNIAQEEVGVITFEDFELPEEHRGINLLRYKFWDKCSGKLLNALLVVVFVFVLATVILKRQMLGVIALSTAAIMMTIAMVLIVRAPEKTEA